MILNPAVPRERLTWAIEHGHPHLRPIYLAVRDYGCAHGVIGQGREPFDLPTDRVAIVLIGDDLHDARGPHGFHRPSLRRVLAQSLAAVVVSSGPELTPYALAATMAAGAVGLGCKGNVILVETRPTMELAWLEFIERERPGIPMTISTPTPDASEKAFEAVRERFARREASMAEQSTEAPPVGSLDELRAYRPRRMAAPSLRRRGLLPPA